jgi:hypothetical protein
MQAPLQCLRSAWLHTQEPCWHAASGEQALPQPPQFNLSVASSDSQPSATILLQSAWVGLHVAILQAAASQANVSALGSAQGTHAVEPHPYLGSVGSAQTPLHATLSAAHILPLAPLDEVPEEPEAPPSKVPEVPEVLEAPELPEPLVVLPELPLVAAPELDVLPDGIGRLSKFSTFCSRKLHAVIVAEMPTAMPSSQEARIAEEYGMQRRFVIGLLNGTRNQPSRTIETAQSELELQPRRHLSKPVIVGFSSARAALPRATLFTNSSQTHTFNEYLPSRYRQTSPPSGAGIEHASLGT